MKTPSFNFHISPFSNSAPPAGALLVRRLLLLHQLLDVERAEGVDRADLRVRDAGHPGRDLPLQHPDHHRAEQEAHALPHQPRPHVHGHLRPAHRHLPRAVVSSHRRPLHLGMC